MVFKKLLPKPKIQVSDYRYDHPSPLRYTTTLLGLNYNRAPDNCFYSHFFLEPCVSLLCCHKSCNSSLSLSLRLRIYIIITILFSEDWWLIYMVHFWQHCALWRFIAVVDSKKLHLDALRFFLVFDRTVLLIHENLISCDHKTMLNL